MAKKAKPVSKGKAKVKPAAKKPAAKKPAAKKPVAKAKPKAKAPAKKVAKPAPKKAVAKKPAKPAPKAAAKKPSKPVAKAPVKTVAKPVAKPIVKVAPTVKSAVVAKTIKPVKLTKSDVPVRYSDKDLEEFRQLIQAKLDKAKKELEILTDAFSHKDGNNTDDTSPTFKLMEDGAEITTKEEIGQLAARQKKFIENLELALLRIQNKTYGVCRVTGKLIPKERLRAVPHATLSMEAKMAQNTSRD